MENKVKNYTSVQEFSEGCYKLSKKYPSFLGDAYEEMPVLLCVNGMIAPFGVMTMQQINGVDCMVFEGSTETMKNISIRARQENIEISRAAAKKAKGGKRK